MASVSPGGGNCMLPTSGSGYYVNTSDGASTCSSSTTETGEGDGIGGAAGTLLVLEPKSLRSFETNDEYLYAMQEDLADWFSCLYQTDISAESFFTSLETGVLLCRHANKVQENARQMRERGETLEMRSYFIRSVPERAVSYRENVKPETFLARDNISNFISWGRQLGIPEVLSFETDDLVLRKNEKSVILCLLELARVGAKLGMLAPTLVQMEEEIDAELAGDPPKPQVQIKTCDMRTLEERVRDLIGRCTCPVQFPMIKVGEGKYKIGDSRSLIFVRILRKHVMVRVGGGWDTLENYLNKHDPCQCNYKGHRAGTSQTAHKVQANQSLQQRRASTPGGGVTHAVNHAPNTPTSPRRMSSVTPLRHRSVSPQNQAAANAGGNTAPSNSNISAPKHNISRSKSPTLIISRHTPGGGVGPGGGTTIPAPNHTSNNPSFSVSRVSSTSSPSQAGKSAVSKSWSQPLARATNNSNSESVPTSNQNSRSKSPSPGRFRTPSPQQQQQQQRSPAPFKRSASGSSLVKCKGQDQKVSTPRRLPGCSIVSDNEEDENENYQADDDDDYDNEDIYDNERGYGVDDILDPSGDMAYEYGSVSFDEQAELDYDQRSSASSTTRRRFDGDEGSASSERNGPECGNDNKGNVTMDKISTMTLTEFKSLLNSSLSVPENQPQNGRSPGSDARSPSGGSDSSTNQNAPNWDSLRDKARSLRDSISDSVNHHRGSNQQTRRSLLQSPDTNCPPPSFSRSANNRSQESSGRTSPAYRPKTPTSVISRPKTPTSSVSRPKTPTSGIARPKTPNGSGAREEYRMSRPKTPSQVKRDAVAKVAGAISNWVDSRPEVNASGRNAASVTPARPKTPTSRPKTPTRIQQRTYDETDADVDEDDSELSGFNSVSAVSAAAKERPATPSRIPKPCFTPRPITPKIASIPATNNSSSLPTRERPHTSMAISSPASSSSSTALSRDQDILLRKQQLERLQRELEEAQQRAEEDYQQDQQKPVQSQATRPNFLPTASLSRSNSNTSSVKSPSDVTPSSHCAATTPKSKIAASRKLPLSRGGSEDSERNYRDINAYRRCVTPGPREKWTIDGQSANSTSKREKQRRGSLNSGCTGDNNQTQASSNTFQNGNNIELAITNEITFSDDEEINELVRNGALVNSAHGSTNNPGQDNTNNNRVRSASVDARQLQRSIARPNSRGAGGKEVLMIRRDTSGGHVVSRTPNKSSTAEKSKQSTPVGILRRPQNRSHGGARDSSANSSASAPNAAARFRSQTPDPSMFRNQRLATQGARPSTPGADARGKPVNRTEAWVDSTLSDPKRKLPSKPRRGMAGVSDIPASELVPRPLEELQAILSTPRDGATINVDAETLEAPPEDPEMFRKMEKLFEKYREMELRASVNDTPGGPAPQATNAGKPSSSGKAGSILSSSGKPTHSVRTSCSSGSHTSSSGVGGINNTRKSALRQNSAGAVSNAEESRYQRTVSNPGSSYQPRAVQSATTSALNSPSIEVTHFVESGSNVPDYKCATNGYPAKGGQPVSNGEAEQQKPLVDIDAKTAKNPTALVSKIKEILKVRPRKDENSTIARTRIPAPASLVRTMRSKSVSNLAIGDLSLNTTTDSNYSGGRRQSKGDANGNEGTLNKTNSGSSGNISYSEFVFHDDEASDRVPELSREWSVQSDSSDSQTRCETPVPKLATPLTTGRSTLISRRGDRLGRSHSQDKENLSNSQTSLSSRSAMSATEEDADYV